MHKIAPGALLIAAAAFAQQPDMEKLHFGFQVRPMVYFAPSHIRTSSGDKTLILFSGGVAPQVGWKKFTFRGGPQLVIPLEPTSADIVAKRNLEVGWFGEVQYNFSRNFFVLGGGQGLPYHLQQRVGNSTATISRNRITQVYGGVGYKWFMGFLGPAWEDVTTLGSFRAIPVRKGVIIGVGAFFDFSWY